MNCRNCGQELVNGMTTCPFCNEPVDNEINRMVNKGKIKVDRNANNNSNINAKLSGCATIVVGILVLIIVCFLGFNIITHFM